MTRLCFNILIAILLAFLYSSNSVSALASTKHNSAVEKTNLEKTAEEIRRGASSTPSRRNFARWILTTGAATATIAPTSPAHAFSNQAFPQELSSTDTPVPATQPSRRRSNIAGPIPNTLVWASALWLLSGSRSNPIATPLANVLYKEENETWLQDRNDGLFAQLPWEFLVILGLVFGCLGFITDAGVTALVESDKGLSLQLAGVSLIGGAFFELGRIATGEKGMTRGETDRTEQLEHEFAQFASDRLVPGGNCHRNEVVQAFRRYYAKYRQVDNEEYPLSDLEIEQLLRFYCRQRNLEMSSAGFYNGIQINQDADVFVERRR